MNHSIRKLLALALAAVLALSLCACGGSGAAKHVNAYGYDSWSVHFQSDDKGNTIYSYMDENGSMQTLSHSTVESLMTKAVASCGDIQLDNRQLNLFYQQTLYDFSSEYADYLAYMMDTSVGMDEQLGLDSQMTWQETIMVAAFENFFQVAALYQEAQKEGFEMTEDSKTFLAELRTGLDEAAVAAGFADADEYLADTFGPGITYDVYYEFSELNSLAMDYATHLIQNIVFDDATLDAYYEENKDLFDQMNIKKVDKNVVSVRHILIEVAEDAEESAWDEAKAEAEAILQEWKDGKATEISFAVLAGEHSDDPGSAEDGGIYENVYPGQMVEAFEEWCFDEARQEGDTGIVETPYGYHIMYFVEEGDYIYWKTLASAYCRTDAGSEQRAEVTAKYKTEYDTKNVIILEYMAPTTPEQAMGAVLNPTE